MKGNLVPPLPHGITMVEASVKQKSSIFKIWSLIHWNDVDYSLPPLALVIYLEI